MLMEPSRQIELHDLVQSEADRARFELRNQELFPENIALTSDVPSARRVVDRFNAYWLTVEPLASALVTGCAWGSGDHAALWTQAVRAVASTVDGPRSGNTYLLAIQEYPVQALVYAAALGAMARKNYTSLKAVTVDPTVRYNRDRNSVISYMAPHYVESFKIAANLLAVTTNGAKVEDSAVADWFQRGGMRHTPISDHLHDLLAPLLKDLVPDQEDYSDLFDETEVLLGALAVDAYLQAQKESRYVGRQWYGRFTWRYRHSDRPLHHRIQAEFEAQGSNWPPLKAGLFDGSAERAAAALDEYCDRGDRVVESLW
ncbi:hypothetical protein SAMN05421678_113215 [Actinopolymorpha cephalotaxi]|uniref:Uncharacterized protein n=1 Tax=Actinopolymorpha cephalotaxi TaxID=504797 RepID=A0A1I2Y4W2_9ACTN|nr:hypothetical protein [Actinopolymorpha cephalotaxi]NYH87334.1 hypothetical protein [Actinopolymorpha cephalotaxi]SFH20774.1 hypothetical protein SAMN05421678_113215 [Actinopolymorpha cephalotaxi]